MFLLTSSSHVTTPWGSIKTNGGAHTKINYSYSVACIYTYTHTHQLCNPTCHCNVKIGCCQLCPRWEKHRRKIKTMPRVTNILSASVANNNKNELLQSFASLPWRMMTHIFKATTFPRQLSKHYLLRKSIRYSLKLWEASSWLFGGSNY